MAESSDIPSKLYYSISEVAKLTGVKAHVLRYWESEFPTLKPRKTRTGSRRYRPADIQHIQEIRALLYDQGFKIAGARKVLRQNKKKAPEAEVLAAPQIAIRFEGLDEGQRLDFLKQELRELQALIRALEGGGGGGAPAPQAPQAQKARKAKG